MRQFSQSRLNLCAEALACVLRPRVAGKLVVTVSALATLGFRCPDGRTVRIPNRFSCGMCQRGRVYENCETGDGMASRKPAPESLLTILLQVRYIRDLRKLFSPCGTNSRWRGTNAQSVGRN